MTNEELYVLYDRIDTDWVENNQYEAYLLLNNFIKEIIHLQNNLQLANESLDLAMNFNKWQDKLLKGIKK